MAHHQRFIVEPTAVGAARSAVALCTAQVGADLVKTLQLLATELVAGAVARAGVTRVEFLELDLSITPRRSRMTLTEPPSDSEPLRTPIVGAAWRRPRLQLLDEVADCWGTRCDNESRVWVEVDHAQHARRCAEARRRAAHALISAPLKKGIS
jgi:hypothetical protein